MSDEPNTVTPNSEEPTFDINRLAQLDADFILKNHPQLQGKVGVLAQKQAQELTAKELRKREEDAMAFRKYTEEQELLALAKEDPDLFASEFIRKQQEEQKQEINRQERARMEEQFANELASEFEGLYEMPLLKNLRDKGDAEVKRRLNWQNYNSIREMVWGMIEVAIENGAKSSDLRDAMDTLNRREALITDKGLGDTGLSPNPSTGRFTSDQVANMDIQTYIANKDKILNQIFK
jgi:hypothetical protein